MKYTNCSFCNEKMTYEEPSSDIFYGYGICSICDTRFFFDHPYNENPKVITARLYTKIHNITYSIDLRENETEIFSFGSIQRITFNKKLPLTPSNINSKLQMYLPLI